jgi:hypothetical protein
MGLPDCSDDGGADTGALAIDYCYPDHDPTPCSLAFFQYDPVINKIHLFDAPLHPPLLTKDTLNKNAPIIRFDDIRTFHNELFFALYQQVNVGLTHLLVLPCFTDRFLPSSSCSINKAQQ